jgi:SnoaL-like domain
MNRDQVASWIAGYEQAWRTPGTESLDGLFTRDASYRQGPYEERVTGLAAIEAMWEAERDGPDEVFRMASEVVAVDGDVAVAAVEVWYGDPVEQEYKDLWIMRFGPDGRCSSFEEWPFWPDQSSTAHGDPA